MTGLAIDVRGLRKVFGGVAAVDGVDLAVAQGSIVGLLGPNGAGKTTTIGCLTTLLRPDAGRLRVAGFDVGTEPAKVRENVSATGQFAALDIMLTGRENLEFFGRLLGLNSHAARSRAEEMLARFDLTDAATKRVKAYSGGMRRRLDLAISLVVPRAVLFLDEPTTGLDPRSRAQTWAAVRQLRADGTSILLTTQYLEEADQLADQIVVIDHGRVIAEGSPRQLKERAGSAVCEIRLGDRGDLARTVAALEGMAEVRTVDAAVVVAAPDTQILMEIVRRLDAAGIEPTDLARRQPSLDEVFLSLTGRQSQEQPV